MNLSMNWLEEFVPVKNTDAKKYSDAMTDTGSKVEGFEILGDDIKNVVVGKIEKMDRHENSDHLWVCQVNIGDRTVQIVTGAQNVFEGALVPAAVAPADLPNGVKIKAGKLRGVESNGMLCSIGELNLTEHDMPGANNDGILILGEEFSDKVGADICDALMLRDTSRYGLDLYGEYSLARLVREITKNTEIPWIRLLYCYPDKITDELIDELRDNDRLVKYMDIPIQHISDSVLARMNRHGGGALIRETVKKLRQRVPGIILRTTAMVGFPGESEEDFAELCEFIKEARFDRFGAFTFSPEEGTPAAEMPDQIDEQTKQDRYDCLMQTQLTVSEEKKSEKVGTTVKVLCDGFDAVAEVYYGRSYADAPDVDGRVYFSSKRKINPGAFVEVKVTEALDYDLVGEVIV